MSAVNAFTSFSGASKDVQLTLTLVALPDASKYTSFVSCNGQ